MKCKVTCPCCNEGLIVSVVEDNIILICESNSLSELETSKLLEELNIEFG